MADDSQQGAGSPADSGRTRRTPPTIELEANEVTTAPKPDSGEGTTEPAGDKAAHEETAEQPSVTASPSASPSGSRPVSPWVIAPFSGAAAAALVIAVGWLLGWPQVTSQVAPEIAPPPAAPAVNASVVDDLSSRVAGIEAKINKPVAPSVDPALAQRADALEKSLASLRGELANLRTKSDQLAAVVNDLKSAPRESGGTVDLSAINDRIAQLEGTVRAQGSEIAQEGEKIAQEGEKIARIKAPDDLPLRRAMEASLLDVALRHGDPYSAMLAAAKALAPDPDALKPLEAFAATGLPSPPMLSRELLNLVPKFSPAPPEPATTGSGIIERLQAGAAKLVRIERTNAVGNDRAAVVTRATAAALHNDIAEARRELNTLSAGDRAPAQAWLDKMDARDAALAASRQFADQAMAALAKPGQ
jgi:hypothetical protein